MPRTLAITLALAAAVAACKEQPAPKAKAPAPVDTNRTLALSEPAGATPADELVRDRQRVVRRHEKKLDSWILLGRAWVLKARASSDPGFYLNAKACAEVALKLDPESNLAFNLQGLVLLNNHEFSAAKTLAEGMLERNPNDAMALGTLSDAYLELGNFAEAARIAQKMLDIKPNLPSYSRAAYLRWLEGNSAGAKEAIRLAFDAGRGQKDREAATWTLVEAANMFWHEGDLDGSLAGYDFALAYNPSYPPALVGKAQVLLAKGDAKAAVKLLESAFTSSPLARTAWLLGDARTAIGEVEGAAAAYEQVEKIGRSGDHLTLALFYATKNRNLEDARKLAAKELESRGSTYVADAMAWVLFRAGKLDEAYELAKKANSLGTKDAMLWYHLGAIELARGDVREGKKRIREALALNARFDYTAADEARQLLER